MKLLLDENLPVKLKYRFVEAGINVFTTRDMQWLGTKNGELVRLMIAEQFDTFLTIDNNLSFQQNFKNYPVRVVVLIAHDNTYETIMSFFDAIISELRQQKIGVQIVIGSSIKK